MRIIVVAALLELFVVAHADIGCYVRGECIQSPVLEGVEAISAKECLSFCKVSSQQLQADCSWKIDVSALNDISRTSCLFSFIECITASKLSS